MPVAWGVAGAGRILLQSSGNGVEVPIFPLVVAVLGIAATLFLSLGALRVPRLRVRRRELELDRPLKPSPAAVEEAPAAPAPVYRKAPIAVFFPMIKAGFPDVWGVREKAVIVFRVEDRGLQGQREVPGLTCTVADQTVPLVWYKGEARLERAFQVPADVPIQVELRVKGEKQPRRTLRPLRIVDYRQEIAELFADFREDASRTITPLRPDSTPWEVYDAILDANPKVSQVALREIVSSFEEAKFSNHPVGRATYEKMLHALRAVKPPAEA